MIDCFILNSYTHVRNEWNRITSKYTYLYIGKLDYSCAKCSFCWILILDKHHAPYSGPEDFIVFFAFEILKYVKDRVVIKACGNILKEKAHFKGSWLTKN